MILRDPATIFRQKHSGQQATQNAKMTLVKPLDRVASTIAFLLSDAGASITGQLIALRP